MSGAAFSKYARDLARVASQLEPLAAKRTLKVAKGAAGMARSIAPTETGALRAGITTVRRPDGSVAVEADTSSHEKYYAHFQEYGTSTMAPNPFIGPAVDRWGPRLTGELEGLVDDIEREL